MRIAFRLVPFVSLYIKGKENPIVKKEKKRSRKELLLFFEGGRVDQPYLDGLLDDMRREKMWASVAHSGALFYSIEIQ